LPGRFFIPGLRKQVQIFIVDEVYLVNVTASIRMNKVNVRFNTLRTGSFKLFKRPLQGFLTILTL